MDIKAINQELVILFKKQASGKKEINGRKYKMNYRELVETNGRINELLILYSALKNKSNTIN